MSLRDDTDLSKFEILGKIGEGRFNAVFKITEKKTKKIYAAKEPLKPTDQNSTEQIHSISREINIMTQINYPSLLKFIGFSPTNFKGQPNPVIISEYALNGSLDNIIKLERKGLSIQGWDDTQKLICIFGIASCMAFMHSKNIIHHDLRLDNILLDEFLYPKVGDFRIKTLHELTHSMTIQPNPDQNSTAFYIAPEIINAHDLTEGTYSEKSDVYSFAYIVYEIITNEIPFKNLELSTIPQKVIQGDRPPFNSFVPNAYKDLISRCWSQNPTDRPSFEQIVNELSTNEEFLSDLMEKDKYYAYIDYVNQFQSTTRPQKVYINPDEYMKKRKLKIKKVDIKVDNAKNSRRSSMHFFKASKDSDTNHHHSHRRKTDPNLTLTDIKISPEKISLYPKQEFSNLSKSCQLLVQGAEKDPEKQFLVGKSLIEGSNEFPQKTDLGVNYLKKSLSKGFVDSDSYSLRLFIDGKIIPQDLSKAKKYVKKALKKSDARYSLFYGKIKKKQSKFQDAKKYFEKAASAGNAEAQYEIGKLYFKGKGVAVDYKEADKYFQMAKKNGCPKSDTFLANHQKVVEMKIVNEDVDENQFKILLLAFSKSPKIGIKEAENYLMMPDFKTYQEFLEDVKKTQKSNCCIVSWTKTMLSARCLDCQLQDNSCICIPCYLAGKHDTHHSYLLGGSGGGNCDCGDPDFWKPSGNCPHHPGPDPDPDLTQMTPLNRKKFITVMKAAFHSAFQAKEPENSIELFQWIQNFIQYGDGLRRCCSIVVTGYDEEMFYKGLCEFEVEPMKKLIDLIGTLVSDRIFKVKMGSSLILHYISLRKQLQSIIYKDSYDKKSKPFYPIKKYLSFSFHFFNETPLMYLIKEKKFNWVDFIIEAIDFTFTTVHETRGHYFKNTEAHIPGQLWYLTKFLEPLMKIDNQHNNLQMFIDRYSRLLQKYEASFVFTFANQNPRLQHSGFTYLNLSIYLFSINCIFCSMFDSSAKNKVFSISETFSALVDYLTSERDLKAASIFGSVNPKSISMLLPLHHLFYCLLSSQQNPEDVIAKECKKKRIDLQTFCSLTSIYPLRFMTTLFVPQLFGHLERDIFRCIEYSIEHPEDSFNIFFGLYQTLLAIAPNKNQLIENAALTMGVFANEDEIPSLDTIDISNVTQLRDFFVKFELIKEIHFEFAIFIMSVLTDRSIITFDKILFKRLRVISLLMINKPNAIDIENFVNDKISNPLFGDDLSSYAERVITSNGSYFRLKNESEFAPFFHLITGSQRLKIFNKYEDKLIPQIDNTALPHGLSFQSCFRSPLFITLMYICLKSKNKLSETQVGLSMFISAIKNGPKYDPSSFTKSSKVVLIEGEKLVDIYHELSNVLKNPSINFSTIKIKMEDDDEATSILELVESNQRIGYEAIKKANLPIKLDIAEQDDEEIQREKKEKAAKLRSQIMKDYKAKRDIFTLGGTSLMQTKKINEQEDENEDDDDDDDEGPKKIDETEDDDYNQLMTTVSMRTSMKLNPSDAKPLCEVCQNAESSDIVGFPCLSIPCLFPSLIHNSLHNLQIPLDDMKTVYQLSICSHPVHFKCCHDLQGDNTTYKCMIDRGERNCLLPFFPRARGNIFECSQSSDMKDAIKDFMTKAFNFDEIDDPLLPLKSFIGIVLMTEVRHRSRPEVLDSSCVSTLLRNLLLTLYFYYNDNESDDEYQTEDPLLKLTLNIISSKTPKSDFTRFVREISGPLEDDYLYEFLRRAAIIDDFALKDQLLQQKEELIDWDELLAFEVLAERYGIDQDKVKLIELPIYETIPLAERFVGLYQPPYNLEIFDISIVRFVDLLTGKVVAFSRDGKFKENPNLPLLQNYVKQYYNGGMAMFLGLTGPNASDLIFSCHSLEKLFNQDGFYIDQFGDTDRGFKRGAILSLSRDRLENALDKLLSGDVLLY